MPGEIIELQARIGDDGQERTFVGRFAAIDTVTEGHKGAFAGSHARYRLAVPVTVLEVVRHGGGGNV